MTCDLETASLANSSSSQRNHFAPQIVRNTGKLIPVFLSYRCSFLKRFTDLAGVCGVFPTAYSPVQFFYRELLPTPKVPEN